MISGDGMYFLCVYGRICTVRYGYMERYEKDGRMGVISR